MNACYIVLFSPYDKITAIFVIVPDVPRVLSIVPLYANESQSLKRLTLTIDINNTRVSNQRSIYMYIHDEYAKFSSY